MIDGAEVTYQNLSLAFSGTEISVFGFGSRYWSHTRWKMDTIGISFERTLFTKVINGISEGTGTLIGKCLYVNDLALFYSAKATAVIKRKIQVAIDMLVENVNSIGLGNKDDLCPILSKARKAPGPNAGSVTATDNDATPFVRRFLFTVYFCFLYWSCMKRRK